MSAGDAMVDIDRLMSELETLAAKSATPAPAVTRVLFTEPDLVARTYLKELCTDAGLKVREDAIGNIFARWEGSRSDLKPIGTGSHVDAIPYSGKYDGTVGVLGGLAAIRTLRDVGFQPVRPIELLIFTSEEPTRFGIGCLGSRALTGSLTPQSMAELQDADGRSFEDARRAAGYNGELDTLALPPGYFAAFVELHIEQGPLLENSQLPIGVVSAIAAPATLRVTWQGEGGHAGAVLMMGRRDALCAAAETVLAVESAANASGSPDTVATTGVCRTFPGAVNSIPDRVVLEIDIRDIELERRDQVLNKICMAVDSIAARRQVTATVESVNADPPAATSPVITALVQSACDDLGLKSLTMVSRAYHDSLFMARVAPTGMIFIPCKEGISHRPEEYCSPESIARGVEVLALTLGKLAMSENPLDAGASGGAHAR